MKIPAGEEYLKVSGALTRLGLSTVCQEARCPNLGECWGSGTATFLLLGKECTRRCRFCAVEHSWSPPEPDPLEPEKVLAAASELKLRYVVLTSVTRDDLEDGGARHIASVVESLLENLPGVRVEALIPEVPLRFLPAIAFSGVSVLAHNLEVARRLTPKARDARASYDGSLGLLREARRIRPDLPTKSSLMLGLGESFEEVVEAMGDLMEAGVEFLTLGQYLRPSRASIPVVRYLQPGEFEELKLVGERMGLRRVFSRPLVRSSYLAGQMCGEA